jgi:hypothetical protein
MRRSLPLVLAAALAFAPSAAAASNVTADDLVKLSAAGLNDDVLVALIESDGAVFKLSADDILALRERGLSQQVILAMLRTATRPAPGAATATTAPRDQRPASVPPPVATTATSEVVTVDPPPAPPPPVVVNVTQQVDQRVEQPRPREPDYLTRPLYVTYPVPIHVAPGVPTRPAPPVYWGFGGQRRPDTWRDK